MRFFIIDCNGCLCGNKNGYATMRGAKQAAKYYSNWLWDLFYCKTNESSYVYKIEQY